MRLSDDCSYCGNAVLPCEASCQVDLEPSTSTDTLSAIHSPPPTSAVPPYTDTSAPSSEDRVASSSAVDLPPSPPSPPVKTFEAGYSNESSSSPCRGMKRSTSESSSSSPDFTPSPSKRARCSVGQPLGIERSVHEKSTSRRDEVEEVWVVGSLAKADGETDARGSGLEATEEDSNTDNLKSLGAASGEARSRNKLRMLVPDIKNKLGKVKKVLGR
ncbi:hypothetical protein SISNIDRAFT_553535 [Sistotremastrum niveocremeum HHB9708]|uniref:Uncharacterized protein n=1 Tax=Sistotremastrum niveocremeum HHB9708 TaxID=1314777 RepID=A0A164MAD9_9AGAM|nr:hypothetical protein SISNIDRAFT_553535 [Sistotremastrum niveocremeum HHB9708]